MLFRKAELQAILSGEVDLAFRRWRRPTVKAGGRLTTPIGILAIDAVVAIDEADIGDADAVRAGFANREALLAGLARREGTLYRISFRLDGPDPRVQLAEQAEIEPQEAHQIAARLGRFDRASRNGPWTRSTLEAIEAAPGSPARLLADGAQRPLAAFKRDVRKLKSLGLTESLKLGYRPSPRGKAYLEWLRSHGK